MLISWKRFVEFEWIVDTVHCTSRDFTYQVIYTEELSFYSVFYFSYSLVACLGWPLHKSISPRNIKKKCITVLPCIVGCVFDRSVMCDFECYNQHFQLSCTLVPKELTFCLFLFVVQTRIAHLLGVAGTDVPIQDIQKLMVPHKVCKSSFGILTVHFWRVYSLLLVSCVCLSFHANLNINMLYYFPCIYGKYQVTETSHPVH